MDFRVFGDAELPIALGAVRATVAQPSADQDGLLASVARLHGVDVDPKLLPQPSLAYTARAFRGQETRRRLLELAVVITVEDCALAPAPAPRVSLLARALRESDHDVRALRERAAYQKLLTRVDFTRRMAARVFGSECASSDEASVRSAVSDVLRASDEAGLASTFHALGRLHPMSFGYSLWSHYRVNKFRFPGEAAGVPERLLAHDVGHVLSGYDTSPEGELQQAAFQSGVQRDSGLIALYAAILQYQFLGRVSPNPEHHAEELDVPKLTVALERGAACRSELGDSWDFWPFVAQHLTDVRRSLGIPPQAPWSRDVG
jgi:hypothetical protein